MKGVIGQNGNILNEGQVFGLDMIISSESLRDLRPVTCISYVETAALTREDLMATMAAYPTCARMIHRAAMLLSLERALPHAAIHRARRSCPFPMAGLRGKVRIRWAAALSFALNASKDPLAVRKSCRFAEKEEELLLREMAHVSGQPLKKIKSKRGPFWAPVVEQAIETVALESTSAVGCGEKKLSDVIANQRNVEMKVDRLADEMKQIKELLLLRGSSGGGGGGGPKLPRAGSLVQPL